MSVIVGIAGAARNAAAALCDGGRIVAVCEQERVTRTRRVGLRGSQLPLEAVETVLRLGGRTTAEVSTFAIAEQSIEPSDGVVSARVERVDHHRAHAATAFLTSPFSDAVVLVCDRHGLPELTVWQGSDTGLAPLQFPWTGPAFASVYGRAARACGLALDGDEHRLEALAHVADRCADVPRSGVTYHGDRLEVQPDFFESIAAVPGASTSSNAVADAARRAAALQSAIGEALLQLVQDVKRRFGGRHLCVGGGLFFNSCFNSLLAQSGLYERMFVPVNPGNAGVAVGAALEAAGSERERVRTTALAPFLGPGFSASECKATLDNCKLLYDHVHDGHLIDRTAKALAQGKLVGWFQGRMEWGPRALGNRSILASPLGPYVLENLNVFLKQRDPHRSYSVSICEEDVARYFRGPATSRFMEYEYEVIDVDVVRALLPLSAKRLRVQTVPEPSTFHTLLKAFGQLTGVPILVNTSFNGFNEPIVCTPRDAVRVFYGTGLDMAVIGNFTLHK